MYRRRIFFRRAFASDPRASGYDDASDAKNNNKYSVFYTRQHLHAGASPFSGMIYLFIFFHYHNKFPRFLFSFSANAVIRPFPSPLPLCTGCAAAAVTGDYSKSGVYNRPARTHPNPRALRFARAEETRRRLTSAVVLAIDVQSCRFTAATDEYVTNGRDL